MDIGNNRILGFDVRADEPARWNEGRREQFLIRLDVEQPFSTDTVVWPSFLDQVPRPGNFVAHQNLWNNLQQLRPFLTLDTLTPAQTRLIAITIELGYESKNEPIFGTSEVPETTPAQVSPSWIFHGYDVSDRWLLSALSNCGFLPGIDNVAALRKEWASKLNVHHLFDSLELANHFSQLSNSRISEHAPFFPFGVWSVA